MGATNSTVVVLRGWFATLPALWMSHSPSVDQCTTSSTSSAAYWGPRSRSQVISGVLVKEFRRRDLQHISNVE